MNEKYLLLKEANESIKTTDIKGKDYAPVNQRIKAFRMVHPEGMIFTDMIMNEGGTVIFKAVVYSDDKRVLATGFASEKAGSSNINKTSWLENCETSAVGRALGFAGFGIDTSVASKEEVENATKAQEELDREHRDEIRRKVDALELVYEEDGGKPLTDVQRFTLENMLAANGIPVPFILSHFNGVKKLDNLTQAQGAVIVSKIDGIRRLYEKEVGANEQS